jgi:hypothetical protein
MKLASHNYIYLGFVILNFYDIITMVIKVKDYNTRMAINIPEDETVKMVCMGMCTIIEGDSKEHLLTYGLGPCVGVSIVIKDNNGKVSRLL